MGTTKLLDKVGKNILEKMGYWVTKNPNRNFRVPENFGSDIVHHFADPKFRVPELKSLLIRIPQTMNTPS